jgi:GAF domain-containing protein
MRLNSDTAYLSELIGRIYDCALRPERWSAVLAEIGALIGARRGVLGTVTPQGSVPLLAAAYGLDDFTPDVQARITPINPLVPLGLVWPIDKPMVASRDFGLERLRASRFHREWLSKRGDYDTVVFAVVRDEEAIGHWALITQDDRGPINDEEVAGLELLAPLLADAGAGPGAHLPRAGPRARRDRGPAGRVRDHGAHPPGRAVPTHGHGAAGGSRRAGDVARVAGGRR